MLVIDPASGAVLLFQYEDDGRRWWATAGGALEGDETFEEAAVREAAEELALSSRSVLPLWHGTAEFSFRGIAVRQEERYFLLRIATGAVPLGQEVREAHRHEGIVAARWWTLDDIETTSEQVFPEGLAQRVRDLRLAATSTEAPSPQTLDPEREHRVSVLRPSFRMAPQRSAARAREFFDVYTKDLKTGDLQRLFTRDAKEAYAFFQRGVDRSEIDGLAWHWRLWANVKLFFLAFTMRLSPARRALFGVALAASILGFLKLAARVGFLELPGPIRLPIPWIYWQDGTFFLLTAFVLLNLLIVLEVADRLSLKHDLNVARDIQLAMLPSGTYRAPGLEIHGETRPANTVGGDFYDLLPLADGRVLVALGDVAGKGSPAALLMALLLAILRTLVDLGLDLSTLMARLNGQVVRHAPPSRFITLFLGIVDPAQGMLTWVNAGQNPPMIRRKDGSIERLGATGVALGMFDGTIYQSERTSLIAGDLLVMYSDGITEAETPGGVPFDDSGLEAGIAAWADASAPEISGALLRAVDRHVAEGRFADDLTVLVVKRP